MKSAVRKAIVLWLAIALFSSIVSRQSIAGVEEGSTPEHKASQAPGPEAAGDEYSLMSLLIKSEYGTDFELILIEDMTEAWVISTPPGILMEKWDGLLKQETLDSLIMKNINVSKRLERKFDLSSVYRLISENEFIGALGDTSSPDWDSFDSTFFDAQGCLTFSSGGFDAGRSQALMIFSNAYRCSGTRTRPVMRKIAFFIRVDGDWKLEGIARGFTARE